MIVNRFVFGCSLFLMTWAALLWGNSMGPPANRSGVSGVTCSTSGCHGQFPANAGEGNVSITGLPAEWTPGATYPLQVSVAHPGDRQYGFQMTAVDSNGAQAGGFVIGGMETAIRSGPVGGKTIEHIQHSSPSMNNTFSFSWMAPETSSTGAVKFNVAANAANGDHTRLGDFIYSTATSVSPVTQTTDNTVRAYSIVDRGGLSFTSSGTAETLRVGYGRIRAAAGSTTPSGIAIFQFRDKGVLISEAGVPAAEPVREGRIFAEVNGPVNTGLAIANPNDETAIIRFYFTDSSGTNAGSGTVELGAHQHIAKFLHQVPFNGGSAVLGTFTFESSVPIAVIALRGFTNEADEFLMTTLPVAPLSPAATETVYIPHFAAGDGWVTQVILVNPTDRTITGTVGFLGPGSGTTAAPPVILTLDDGSTGSSFEYSIPPRSAQRFTTGNSSGALNSGSVRATPHSGNAAPSGLVVFSYALAGKTLSEAGVPALPKGSAFRVYAEASGTPEQTGSVRSGLAIANTADTSNTVTLELTHLDGSLAVAPATLALPPSGQVARFLDEFFSLPDNFSGMLRVTSTADVAIVALRLRVNEKGEIKVTTLAPSNEMDPSVSEDSFFSHLADSGGWSTQFILFSGTAGQASSGTLAFIDSFGQPLDLPALMLAPADEASFNDLVVGKRIVTFHPAVYADFVSPGRFRETVFSDISLGNYTYENTGPNTGTLTFNYDDGARCTASITFDSTTTGTATVACDTGSNLEYSWQLVEIPSG